MVDWVEAKVVENRRWAKGLYSLRFEADIGEFIAGQFTRIAVDVDGERVARPYSFVNAPAERPIEIYYNTVPEGPLSNRLAALDAGARLWIAAKAGGLLTLREVPDAEVLWLLATGTAIGPFLSILKTEEPWRRFSRIVLAHATRFASELTYRDVVERMGDERNGQLSYVPFVTRERTDFALPGRISAAIADGTLEGRVGLHLGPEDSHVMVCGNSEMIRDTLALLEERGMHRHSRRAPGHVTTEKYH